MFQQLQSPEWQLCGITNYVEKPVRVKDEETGEWVLQERYESVPFGPDELYICSTDNPSELLLQFGPNVVKEDSFELTLRRKTKLVPTNAFLSAEDIDEYARRCPVDNTYQWGD